MATVFINYRTGDGDKTALLIDKELSGILGGEDHVFRATRSIKPGQHFPEELLRNVRRATVVLAVIGPAWCESLKLRDKDDWVRRELLEALTLDIPVVPVLEGRGARHLNSAELPLQLKWLADVQSELVNVEDLRGSLTRLFARLSEWIPSLSSISRPASPSENPDSGGISNSASNVHGPTIQGRDITTRDITTGDTISGRTVIGRNYGTTHTGKGNVYNYSHPQHFSRNERFDSTEDRGRDGSGSSDFRYQKEDECE
ncbi:toll/interleukin-1 receptor domain-containing protein [Nonomuraea maritima]|uniref:toll/interleukin-1 receptor domain-containing protein n=1 Tax=Nonomuraea maritima TaxID=683260 RepID=UPI00372020CD